ncbi:MAG: hypothetical protein ABI743_05155, partial [bacterium]
AQPPQGQLYDLDIANFLSPSALQITGVQVLGSGNFRVTFSHSHPFPAPNVANPITGINRADLGYTGRLVILTEGNPQLFYGGTVRVSARTVVGADGYAEFGDLLVSSHPTLVNAYPYKLLADEDKDNRVGVSNGGAAEGNYASASGGWQRANLGASGSGWTGYDYLHGGQTITNTFVLDKDAVGSGTFALNLAIVIQYQDPRGVGGKTMRLPPATTDVLQFAYRLPYAALDCSLIGAPAALTVSATIGSLTPVALTIRDWDTNATESADAKVGDEADVSKVQLGGSGPPTVEIDAPALSATPVAADGNGGTGPSDDPLTFDATLTNTLGTAVPGEYWALVRAIDAEDGDAARGTYHTGVDGNTILPDADLTLAARTYQLIPITIPEALAPPVITSVSPAEVAGALDEYATFGATATNSPTSWSWDFGGGTLPAVSIEASPEVQLHPLAGIYSGMVIASNAAGDSAPFAFSYRILPPVRPEFTAVFLQPSALSVGAPDSGTLQVVNGRPSVFFTTYTNPSFAVRIARALTDNPVTSGDWALHAIDTDGGSNVAGAVVGGRLAVVYSTGVDDPGARYTYATVDEPLAPGDWRITTAKIPIVGQTWGRVASLVDYGGRPAFVTRDSQGVEGTWYFRSTVTEPLTPANWNAHFIFATATVSRIVVQSFPGGPRPVIALNDTADTRLVVLGAEIAEPSNETDWTLRPFFSSAKITTLDAMAGRVIGSTGYVDVITQSTTARYYDLGGTSADALGARRAYALPIDANDASNVPPAITSLNGRPAVVYYSDTHGETIVARALRSDPLSTDWESASLASGFAMRFGIASHHNRLALSADTGSLATGWNYYQASNPW